MEFGKKSKEISLYFHFPLCLRKCPYCHFYVLPYKKDRESALIEGFFLEWEKALPLLQSHRIASIYFGGGSPSLFQIKNVSKLFALIRESGVPLDENIEITLEANPEDVTLEKAKAWKNLGINRISLGVQTLDVHLLQFLKRTHSAEQAKNAVKNISKEGIENISIDLMFELPNQTLESFEKTLWELQTLPITHLSLYNLSYEKGSAYFKNKEHLIPLQPSQEIGTLMWEKAIRALEEIGLLRYEISAFAKKGYHSRHNTGYWKYRPYLGFGPSSFSYFEGRRYRNAAHLGKWHRALKEGVSPVDFEETLPYPDNIKERTAIGLRLIEGIPFPEEMRQPLAELEKEGFVRFSQESVKLTEKGLLFYDTVAEKLI